MDNPGSPTLLEIIKNIQNILNRGRQSDDDQFADDQIKFIVDYYRAKLISEKARRGRSLSPYIQDLGKVELIKADKNECCDIEDCILRVKNKPMPRPVVKGRDVLITRVASIGNSGHISSIYQKTYENSVYWDSFRAYTSSLGRWYYKDGAIYIVNPQTTRMRYINIQGIFQDPTAANTYRTCDCPNEEECYPGYDYPYPIDSSSLDVLYKLMAQSELNWYSQSFQDTLNDTIEKERPLIDDRTSG